MIDLVLRRTLLEGFSSLGSLARSLCISPSILDQVFRQLRSQQMVEVKGMAGNDYQFVLSQAGKQMASDRFQVSQYAGACPVALRDYHAATKRQSARVNIDRSALRAAFSDLVVPDRLLDQLGPALISQNSIFLYGPSGNGKTSIAERMLRVYQDSVLAAVLRRGSTTRSSACTTPSYTRESSSTTRSSISAGCSAGAPASLWVAN